MTMTQAEMQERSIARAGEDSDFRLRLVADPRAANEELTGTLIPDAFTVQAHEESATSFHLAPPSNRLTEGELGTVFGGDWASDWAQA